MSGKSYIRHCSIREDLDVYGMFDCAFLIFNNCDPFIKEFISLLSGWFCSVSSIHALKTKRTIIWIEMNFGVRYFKPVQIKGWWTDKDSFMNGNICILEWITYIQNPGSESMYRRDSNVDYEEISMCHWAVELIKSTLLIWYIPFAQWRATNFHA